MVSPETDRCALREVERTDDGPRDHDIVIRFDDPHGDAAIRRGSQRRVRLVARSVERDDGEAEPLADAMAYE